jgi:hypothetical protein
MSAIKLRTLINLVTLILEYCSIIWNPYQNGLSEAIERVQRRFLRLIACKRNTIFNINQPIYLPLSSVQTFLNLNSLEKKCRYNDICFLSKLVNDLISCPELL